MIAPADPELPFSALERRVLEFLAVPAAPEIPDGSAASVRVFRAGDNFYAWLVLKWAAVTIFAAVGLLGATFAVIQIMRQAPRLAQIGLSGVLLAVWSAFAVTAAVTFLARRLNFRMRWYIVTDRSLRLRSGIFMVDELTMTYRNIQEIRVTSGPLQHALRLATVEVHAAGGGGDARHGGGGHVGRLEGLANANDIRDLMVDRLRQYRDAGLGDAPHVEMAGDVSELTAAREMLAEARALRAAIATRQN